NRGKPQDHISRRYRGSIDNRVPVDYADDEARDIVFAFAIKPGHFGGLAADQGAVGFSTAASYALNDLSYRLRHESRGGDVIHEEDGAGPLYQNIVNAVANQIVADGVVNPGQKRDSELGADSVGGRDQDWLAHSAEVSAKHAAE